MPVLFNGLRAAAALVLMATSASAQGYIQPVDIDGWEGGGIDNTGNGAPDFCQIARQDDRNQTLLAIWLDSGLYLAPGKSGWALNPGQNYETTLTIGDVWVSLSNAPAHDNETLIIAAGENREFIDALKSGASLMLSGNFLRGGGIDVYEIELPDPARAFTALENCYRVQVAGLGPIETPPPPAPEPVSEPEAVVQQDPPPAAPPSRAMTFTMARHSTDAGNPDPECPGTLDEKMSFVAPENGGPIAQFSYSFSMKTRFLNTVEGECVIIEKTGTLVSGNYADGYLDFVVNETNADGSPPVHVTYEGEVFADGTVELFNVDAPYELLPVTMEAAQ